MKHLILSFAALLLIGCTSGGNAPIYESGDYGDRRVSGDYLDQLRGKHPGRDAEDNAFSRALVYSKTGVREPGPGSAQVSGPEIKIYWWKSGGRINLQALRATRARGRLYWSGTQPGTRYHGADLRQMILSRPSHIALAKGHGAPLSYR